MMTLKKWCALLLFLSISVLLQAQDDSGNVSGTTTEAITQAPAKVDVPNRTLGATHPKLQEAQAQLDALQTAHADHAEAAQEPLDRNTLAGSELHVVGMYMPKDHNRDDRVYVDVKPTGKPMVLVLTGYFGAEWHLKVDPKADVRQVIVAGYYKHELAEPRPDVPIAMLTYFPKADKSNRNFFWAYAWHTAEGRELSRRLKDLTGLEVTTFQGEYSATRFIVDGQRGRDVVNDTTTVTASEAHPSFLGGLLQDLIGTSDTDDRPPKVSQHIDTTAAVTTVKESQTPAIRRSLETAREQAESQHRDAEQASLQAAAAYRDELSQAAPDPQALGERRTKLQQAVKAAFDAQMLLQQIRLQLAERDLAEVKAKHVRRESLAAKIIERRVADLMQGDNLDWSASQESTASVPSMADAAQGDSEQPGLRQLEGTVWEVQGNDFGVPLNDSFLTQQDLAANPDVKWFVKFQQGTFRLEAMLNDRWTTFWIAVMEATGTEGQFNLTYPNSSVEDIDQTMRQALYVIDGDRLELAIGPERPLKLIPGDRVFYLEGKRSAAPTSIENSVAGSTPRPSDFSDSVGTVQTWKREEALPTFATPQELLDYVGGSGDDDGETLRRYISVLTDDEADRFAGVMTRTISGLQAVTGLVAAFGADSENGEISSPQFIEAMTKLGEILKRHERNNPPPEAQAARQKVQMQLNIALVLFGQNGAPAPMSAEAYSILLRRAAGTLDDSKAFLLDTASVVHTVFEKNESKPKSSTPVWDIRITGESAVAVNIADVDSEFSITKLPESMALMKVGGTWKISSMFSDQSIIELQEGMSAKESSVGDETDSSPLTATTTTPAMTVSPAMIVSPGSTAAPEQDNNPLERWLRDIRSISADAAAKRDAALAEVEAALKSDDIAQNIAATQALAQTGDVKYEKAKYRERILELCRSSNRDLVKSALYALHNTDRKPEDLALAQEVLSKPEAAWAGHSISHLLMMFGDGEISGKSEEIVLSLLNSADRSVRREALRGLWGAKTSDKLMDRVIELVDDQESHHDAIYFALSTSPDKNAAVVDKLIEVLSDPDWNNWDRALWGLGYGVRESERQKVADAMLQMYENRSDPKTRGKCEKLIQQYGSPEQIQKLIESAASETESKP